jgi:type III secretory pathway component EscT
MNKRQRKLLIWVGIALVVGGAIAAIVAVLQKIFQSWDEKSKTDKMFNLAMLAAFNQIVRTANSASDWASSYNNLTE